MARDRPLLGGKVRRLRRREGWSQAQLADKLHISASYLNLIEHNRRPLTAPLLIELAQLFELDIQSFASEDDARLLSELMEVFSDALFEPHGLAGSDIRELCVSSPGAARAVVSLYEAYQAARESARSLATQLSDDADRVTLDRATAPSEEVSELIEHHQNHFPELEEGAERLRSEAAASADDLFGALARYGRERHGVTVEVARVGEMRGAVRRYDGASRRLTLSEALRRGSRNFQLAHQLGLLSQSDVLDRLVADRALTTPQSRTLGRVALASYFAGAVLMPYGPFAEAAQRERYDIEVLGHRFRTSFEQVCHRLTTLRRPGVEGVAFHMVRVDIAGNISKHFAATGMRFPRFSAACPRWNVYAAFLTPGITRVQVSRMPDGTAFFDVARTVRQAAGGYHAARALHAVGIGCAVEDAGRLVYSDGVDWTDLSTAQPIGVTCRLCERTDCEQRAMPPLLQPLRVDENIRGLSFYAPLPEV